MKKKLLITDLDNTLFDWVNVWFASFDAMLEEIAIVSGIDRETLIPDIRTVHQKHGTSEYAFLIEEIESLKRKFGEFDATEKFYSAIHAYSRARKKTLALYPTVMDTLQQIKESGCQIFGYTESMAFYSNYRVRKLGLDGVIDIVFSPKDHDVPIGLNKDALRRYPSSHYEFDKTMHETTPEKSFKPDVKVLESIIAKSGFKKSECVYVGDSLTKDIQMAQDTLVDNAWAEYGLAQDTDAYQLLRAVTHWTDEDVEREKRIGQKDTKPNIVLDSDFSQILKYFDF